jgi:hypothetical protein
VQNVSALRVTIPRAREKVRIQETKKGHLAQTRPERGPRGVASLRRTRTFPSANCRGTNPPRRLFGVVDHAPSSPAGGVIAFVLHFGRSGHVLSHHEIIYRRGSVVVMPSHDEATFCDRSPVFGRMYVWWPNRSSCSRGIWSELSPPPAAVTPPVLAGAISRRASRAHAVSGLESIRFVSQRGAYVRRRNDCHVQRRHRLQLCVSYRAATRQASP